MVESDRLVRAAEIAGICSGLDAAHRLFPGAAPASLAVAGGLAAFAGVDSPLSQTYAIGCDVPVTDEDLERIGAFYAARGATPRVFVSPLADVTLGRRLAALGYVPAEYESVLFCAIEAADAVRDPRIRESRDVHEWALASTTGFCGDDPPPEATGIGLTLASSRGVVALAGYDGETLAATAALDVRGGVAALFAASTLPPFRNRGWQFALIRDRLARAREAGAAYARATAKPGSVSERNFARCGLRVLYTKCLWECARPL